MTIYEQVNNYKSTEFYNINPTHYFSIYDMRLNEHCLCFKVTDSSYLNMKTYEYIKLNSNDLDMMVDVVQAKVEWHYVEDSQGR